MLVFLGFEARRLFYSRSQAVIWLLVLLLTGYTTFSAVLEHRGFLREKAAFLEYEREKSLQYINYAQYGALGFKVLLEPTGAGVFSASAAVMRNVQCNIDATETLRVEASYKGRQLFQPRGSIMGVSSLLLLLGSLLMLAAGGRTFRDLQTVGFLVQRTPLGRFFFGTLTARLVWLNLALLAIMTSVWAFSRSLGLTWPGADTPRLLQGGLYLLLLLDFFFLLGVLVSLLSRPRSLAWLWMLVIWFLTMFLVPEYHRLNVAARSMGLMPAEQINLENLKTLMALERQFLILVKKSERLDQTEVEKLQARFAQEFLDSGYLLNISREQRYLHDVRGIVATYERQSLVLPTTYFDFLSGEMSSRGYYAYLRFMDYIFDLRHRFIRWYVEKRYFSRDPSITPFVRGQETVFISSPQLPRTFPLALGLLFGECLALLALSKWQLQRLLFPRP